jgi:hypothetical protein
MNDTCMGSTIEEIEYGDIPTGQVETKLIATAARFTLKCRLGF